MVTAYFFYQKHYFSFQSKTTANCLLFSTNKNAYREQNTDTYAFFAPVTLTLDPITLICELKPRYSEDVCAHHVKALEIQSLVVHALTLTRWPWYTNFIGPLWTCTCLPNMNCLHEGFRKFENIQTDARDRKQYYDAFEGGNNYIAI